MRVEYRLWHFWKGNNLFACIKKFDCVFNIKFGKLFWKFSIFISISKVMNLELLAFDFFIYLILCASKRNLEGFARGIAIRLFRLERLMRRTFRNPLRLEETDSALGNRRGCDGCQNARALGGGHGGGDRLASVPLVLVQGHVQGGRRQREVHLKQQRGIL